MKQTLKLIAINIVVAGFLLSLLNLLAVSSIILFNASKPKQYANSHLFPNYRSVTWARQHFAEYDNLTKGYYKSFYAWRRPAFEGQTINIDAAGLRHTFQSAAPTDRVIAFFGGSTTWGTGATDETTIPSYFVKLNPSFQALNFGETGYVAHQSLNLFLEKYFAGFRPEVVVFYDGVNDVWNKCRTENDAFSHSREHLIRVILQERSENSYLAVIEPIKDFVGRLRRTLQSRQKAATAYYDCDEKPAKAALVARVLLSDWMIVKHLVEGYGGKFIGILQPQAYDSKTKLDHLELDPVLGKQYGVVYPMILDLVQNEFAALQENFHDLRTALDQDDYFYIDWCHLSPNGNEIIARRLSEAVAERTGPATAQR